METTKSPQSPLRYRLYYWLMDWCTVCLAIGLAERTTWLFTARSAFGLSDPLSSVLMIPVVGTIFYLPLCLILARFMRDDYAEMLWKRTAVAFVYLVVTLPLFGMVIIWSTVLVGAYVPDFQPVANAMQEFVSGAVGNWIAINIGYIITVVLFVLIFQFLRWRDSR